MTSGQNEPADGDRGLTPADLHDVRFTRASMLRPGYVDTEVDRVMHRLAEELTRHIAERAELRGQVRSLQAQLVDSEVAPQVPPSDQAVRILASAQQTADNYVAEAEEFSRQMTSEARAEYEERIRAARENAGAIIHAAQEAAARMTGPGPVGEDAPQRTIEELEQQVAYLKAFGQACRVQLRSYLEALLTDVENEWGRADPAALPQGPPRPPAQRSSGEAGATSFADNTVAEPPADAGARGAPAANGMPAAAGSRPTG